MLPCLNVQHCWVLAAGCLDSSWTRSSTSIRFPMAAVNRLHAPWFGLLDCGGTWH
jgi:hypothetical protein